MPPMPSCWPSRTPGTHSPSAEATYASLTNTARHEGRVPDTVSTIIAALRAGIGEGLERPSENQPDRWTPKAHENFLRPQQIGDR